MLDPTLREKLLALETETPSLKSKYEKEIKAMIDQQLTPWQRTGWIAGIIFGLLMAAGCSTAFIILLYYDLSPFLYFIFVITAFYGLGGAVYSFYIVKKGKVNLRTDRTIEMVMVWVFVAIFVFAHMLWGTLEDDPAKGNHTLLMGMFVLFIAGMGTTIRYVERTGVAIKESLLRLELQLAELKEKPADDPKDNKAQPHEEMDRGK